MKDSDIPADVLRFITENIDSVPQLETLLLLWENPDIVWTEAQVAARLYVPDNSARALLQVLRRRRLLRVAPGSEHGYQYDPTWDSSGDQMQRVAHHYRRQLVQIANFIHRKASVAVLDFARAFHLKDK